MADPVDPQIRQQQREVFASKIERAREMTIEQKILLTLELSEEAMEWTRQTIQAENPGWGPEEVAEEMRRRRAIQRRIEDQGLFVPYHETGEQDS